MAVPVNVGAPRTETATETEVGDRALPTPPPLIMCSEVGSFANKTVRERLPAIVARTSSELATLPPTDHLEALILALDALAGEIAGGVVGAPEEAAWKAEAEPWIGRPWTDMPMLFGECLLYRRITEAVEASGCAADGIDPFALQKQGSFRAVLPVVRDLAAEHLATLERLERDGGATDADVDAYLRLSLWGNKADLSLFPHLYGDGDGNGDGAADGSAAPSSSSEDMIIVDHSAAVVAHLRDGTAAANNTVGIVLDNAGMELFNDLLLADFLVTGRLADRVELHCKDGPFFVSDATPEDLEWMLSAMEAEAVDADGSVLAALAARWRTHLGDGGAWAVTSDPFWRTWHGYWAMPTAAPGLYEKLCDTCAVAGGLVVFKGDLNYRRLFGDCTWSKTTAISDGLQSFRPGPILSLRTCKADIALGLASPEAVAALDATDPEWCVNGTRGMIAFCEGRP